MNNTKNRCLTALAYKLIDHFPTELILFGGFVRDVIVPAIFEERDPFAVSYVAKTDINDIDLLFHASSRLLHAPFPEEEAEKETDGLELWIHTNLILKLREWDWLLGEKTILSEYEHDIGIRVQITHTLTGVTSHLDIIYGNVTNKDIDVNQFFFNKKNGLTLNMRVGDQINHHVLYQQRFLSFIKNISLKQCRMICGVTAPKAPKRLLKMIRKGWKIKNLNPEIIIHCDNMLDICQICHQDNAEEKWIELSCSRCRICLECFEQLFIQHIGEGKGIRIPCPTCRKNIIPWE